MTTFGGSDWNDGGQKKRNEIKEVPNSPSFTNDILPSREEMQKYWNAYNFYSTGKTPSASHEYLDITTSDLYPKMHTPLKDNQFEKPREGGISEGNYAPWGKPIPSEPPTPPPPKLNAEEQRAASDEIAGIVQLMSVRGTIQDSGNPEVDWQRQATATQAVEALNDALFPQLLRLDQSGDLATVTQMVNEKLASYNLRLETKTDGGVMPIIEQRNAPGQPFKEIISPMAPEPLLPGDNFGLRDSQ